MSTTPGIKLRVYVGGTRKVYKSPAKWVEYGLQDIGVQGREDDDKVVFVPGIGWRIIDVQMDGGSAFEKGEDAEQVFLPDNINALLASYDDDGEDLKVKANQRYPGELAIPQYGRTTQGDFRVHKNARPSTLMDVLPAPPFKGTVPLDRVLVSTGQFDADDAMVFAFGIKGSGSRDLGDIHRVYFPGLAGTTKADAAASRHGTGRYAMTFAGNGQAYLYEMLDDDSWVYRRSFRYASQSDAIGREHLMRVTSDAQRDGDGNLFGRVMSFAFSAHVIPPRDQNGAFTGSVGEAAVFAVDVATMRIESFNYEVPNASIDVQPTPFAVRCDARPDCDVTFVAKRIVFRDNGLLRVKTFALAQPPKDGKIHCQVFGSFPAGTEATLKLYGAKTGTLCGGASVVASNVTKRFIDFNAIEGERSYILNVELAASSDLLRSPTIKRVRFLREAVFETITEGRTELKNVTTITTTGAGADPSTETLGLVCWSYNAAENAILKKNAGQHITVEADFGLTDPEDEDSPRKISVLFRGILREARRKVVAGKGKQGFGGTSDLRDGPLLKYTIKAVSEWDWLCKRLAPGRLDFAYDSNALTAGQAKPFRITDIIRFLLLAILPPERVDVPDIDVALPLDLDAPTFIEKYQPVMAIVMTLVRDYLGGYMVLDSNASREADPTDEGMWRVLIAPKKPFKPVVGFVKEAIVPGISITHPAAYPPGTAIEGEGEGASERQFPRTFLRHGSDDEWIEAPVANQIVVRGSGVPRTALTLGKGGALTVVLNNWKAASFAVERNLDNTVAPQQGAAGGPPAPDPNHIDYTTGDVVTLEHSDPMLNTENAVYWIALRLFHLRCHGKKWQSGEAPIVFVTKETTLDPLQKNPRPLRYADIALLGDEEYVISESPSLLCDGTLGGSQFVHGYYALFSAPPDDTYRPAYGDNGT